MPRSAKRDTVDALVSAWRSTQAVTRQRDDLAFRLMGINATDARCLEALDHGEVPASALAAACGVSLSSFTSVVDRLVAKGLVERRTDAADRRRVLVGRTARADRIREQVYGPVAAWSRANLERLTIAELELITRYTVQSREVQERHLDYLRDLDLDVALDDGHG